MNNLNNSPPSFSNQLQAATNPNQLKQGLKRKSITGSDINPTDAKIAKVVPPLVDEKLVTATTSTVTLVANDAGTKTETKTTLKTEEKVSIVQKPQLKLANNPKLVGRMAMVGISLLAVIGGGLAAKTLFDQKNFPAPPTCSNKQVAIYNNKQTYCSLSKEPNLTGFSQAQECFSTAINTQLVVNTRVSEFF
ncbi:MAG: hypothetical protein H0X29_00555 [Parachlamydiaceae bacterium]|nr:hypothetical protein [Parachlamydiaceae bacterium]